MKQFLPMLIAIALLSACATGPKVDWQSRVNNFNFDQAVTELGPPDKDVTLSDGRRVSEWITAHSRTGGAFISNGRYGYVQRIDPGAPDYYLRLTFDKNGQLQAWKKYAK